MAKTITSLLVGIAVAEGKIPSLDEPAATWLPAWRDDGRRKITLRHLLQMHAGLTPMGEYTDPFSDAAYLALGTDLRYVVDNVTTAAEPGKVFDYNNVNFQALGFVLEAATGKRYAEYLSEKLWRPLGAADASIWLDREGGSAHASGYLFAEPEDWAKVGLMLLHHGEWDGRQVVPREYLRDMLVPSPEQPAYGLGIWLADDAFQASEESQPFQAPGVFYLDGHSKQRVYVVPSHELVIVRVGENGRRWDESALVNAVLRGLPAPERPCPCLSVWSQCLRVNASLQENSSLAVDLRGPRSTRRYSSGSTSRARSDTRSLPKARRRLAMRFMVMVPASKESEAGVLPDEKILTEMGKFNEEMVKAGVMLAGEGLQASSKGARIAFSGGKTTVIDGPFTESKELIAGFWLIQVKSKEEAIAWMKRSPIRRRRGARDPPGVRDGGLRAPSSPRSSGSKKNACGTRRPRGKAIEPVDFEGRRSTPNGAESSRSSAGGKPAHEPRSIGDNGHANHGTSEGRRIVRGGCSSDQGTHGEMGKFIEEIMKAGVLLATDGLHPSSKGKRVRLSGGKTAVTDGPFTESKELIAGYALFQVKSMAEAIEWSKRFLQVLGQGEVELRPVFEASDFPPELSPAGEPRVTRRRTSDAEGRAAVIAARLSACTGGLKMV